MCSVTATVTHDVTACEERRFIVSMAALSIDIKAASAMPSGGQRIATLLMYLNDVEFGGETAFPYANASMQHKNPGMPNTTS